MLEAEGKAALWVEGKVPLWVKDKVTLGTENEATLGAKAESASSRSLSYTKLKVVGKKDVSSDAILWIWSISDL